MTALYLLLFSFLIPNELGITIGVLALPPYRIVLLLLALYLIWPLLQRGSRVNWNLCDAFALAIFIWPFIAYSVNTNFAAAVESGGALVLEMAVPYLYVRLHINDYRSRKVFAKALFLFVGVLFVTALPDFITGQHQMHKLAYSLIGETYTGIPEKRIGLWRAKGVAEHAILLGTMCASILAVSIFMAMRQPKYWLPVGFALGGAFISLSSAPILVTMVQLGLIAWAMVMRTVKNKWLLLSALIFVAYVLIDIASNRDPIRVMFSYLLLNSQTGYARYYMWINTFDVLRNTGWMGMIFGNGINREIFEVIANKHFRILMQHTVDSYWLVLMLRYGFTMALLHIGLLYCALRQSLKQSYRLAERKDRRMVEAWSITLIAVTLAASTVHFWAQAVSFYMIIIAVCAGTAQRSSRSVRTKMAMPAVHA